jgi:hypothetical protein
MSCELCRTFILDYLHNPLHQQDRLSATFHHSTLLKHKETVYFWIQRALLRLTHPILKKAKSDTEMDFWLANQQTVEKEAWNKAFLKNLKQSNTTLCIELTQLQTVCEECGFVNHNTGLFFLENYILPLLQMALEIHSEHSIKHQEAPVSLYKQYTEKQLREEYGNLYD